MKYTAQILWKVLAKQFYSRNAGFFLFLFVVLFGIVAQNPMAVHFQLMKGIVSSNIGLFVALILFTLFNLKCVAFVLSKLNGKENALLFETQALLFKSLFPLLFVLAFILFAPVFIYAIITLLVGIHLGYVASSLIILIYLIAVLLLTVYIYYLAVMKRGIRFQLPTIDINLPKKFFAILFWHSLYKGKIKITMVKFFSFTMLFIPLVWNGGHFPLSDFILFYQACIIANAIIVYDYVQFLERDFSALRNMPIPVYKIFLLYLFIYPILILPEFLILLRYAPSVLDVSPVSLCVYFLGQLLLFTSIAYEKQMKVENHLGIVSLISACFLFVTPLAPFYAVGIALIIVAFIMFCMLYYKYEIGL